MEVDGFGQDLPNTRGAVQSAETYILQMALVMQKQFGYKKKSRTKCKI